MTPSPLIQRQHAFALAVADLIVEAARMDYLLGLGEAWRSPQEAARLAAANKGISNSLHTDRLALDLVLRTPDGVALTASDDYARVGEWWERRYAFHRCAWGGRFRRPDGNHFSFQWAGRK